jgi:hypothetical protein
VTHQHNSHSMHVDCSNTVIAGSGTAESRRLVMRFAPASMIAVSGHIAMVHKAKKQDTRKHVKAITRPWT